MNNLTKKYAVHYIGVHGEQSYIHTWALTPEQAKAIVGESGYGYSNGTLFPREITKVEVVRYGE
jgi:hypothetical protein